MWLNQEGIANSLKRIVSECVFRKKQSNNSQSLSLVQTAPLTQEVLPDLLAAEVKRLIITNQVNGRHTILLRRTGHTKAEAVGLGRH